MILSVVIAAFSILLFDKHSAPFSEPMIEHVLVGFNINLDALIRVTTEAEILRVIELIETHSPDIKEIFLQQLRDCEAAEELVPASLPQAMLDEFEHTFVLGGQEGFFLKNVAHTFPEKKCVLHLPNRAPQMVDFVKHDAPGAFVFQNGELISIQDVEANSDDVAPVHIVLEYSEGIMFEGAPLKRANRFIFTFDETNSNLHLDTHFVNSLDVIDNTWAVLLSGHHLIEAPIVTPEFREFHLRTFNSLCEKAAWVHYELACQMDPEVRQFIVEYIQNAHSIGLNEAELELYAKDHISDFDEERPRHEYISAFLEAINYQGISYYHSLGRYIASSLNKLPDLDYQAAFKLASATVFKLRATEHTVAEDLHLEPLVDSDNQISHMFPRLTKMSSTVGLGDTISSTLVLGSL